MGMSQNDIAKKITRFDNLIYSIFSLCHCAQFGFAKKRYKNLQICAHSAEYGIKGREELRLQLKSLLSCSVAAPCADV